MLRKLGTVLNADTTRLHVWLKLFRLLTQALENILVASYRMWYTVASGDATPPDDYVEGRAN